MKEGWLTTQGAEVVGEGIGLGAHAELDEPLPGGVPRAQHRVANGLEPREQLFSGGEGVAPGA